VGFAPPWPGILTLQPSQDKSNGPDHAVPADVHCKGGRVGADTQDEQETFLT
jgi:hypothetical protein